MDEALAISQVAYDPTTDLWRLRINIHGTERWSQPMPMASIQRLLKAEYERRVRDGQRQQFYATQISAEALLQAGILSSEPHRVDASHPTLVRAKKRQADIAASIMSAEDILKAVGEP